MHLVPRELDLIRSFDLYRSVPATPVGCSMNPTLPRVNRISEFEKPKKRAALVTQRGSNEYNPKSLPTGCRFDVFSSRISIQYGDQLHGCLRRTYTLRHDFPILQLPAI